MKILFDEDAPRPLRRHLPGHDVTTVQEMGWAGIKNGRLLTLAESAGFEVLLTFDQNMSIAIVAMTVPNKRMETLLPLVPQLLSLLLTVRPGHVHQVIVGAR